DLVPQEILARKKQPYRAPDALSFVGTDAPEWIAEVMSGPALEAAGIFDPALATRFHRKCIERRDEAQFSNADNMALVGILSTQLLHHEFVAGPRGPAPAVAFRTLVDRVGSGAA
ncbi:MAG TPA: asparagine synthase-related protein, partial [Dongiaceae bacterium]|nr:asparagine synthase-related protein [Dongiaceae bacterium]